MDWKNQLHKVVAMVNSNDKEEALAASIELAAEVLGDLRRIADSIEALAEGTAGEHLHRIRKDHDLRR